MESEKKEKKSYTRNTYIQKDRNKKGQGLLFYFIFIFFETRKRWMNRNGDK